MTPSEERRAEDLAFMRCPRRWAYAVLPLKRLIEGQHEFAILIDCGDGTTGRLHKGMTPFGPWEDPDLEGVVLSHEEILNDGWKVD